MYVNKMGEKHLHINYVFFFLDGISFIDEDGNKEKKKMPVTVYIKILKIWGTLNF